MVTATAAESQTRAASGVGLVRLGVVRYLNAAPLVYGLDDAPGFELRRDVPSRVAADLHAGRSDLGIIPSIEYAAGEYAIVPGAAITSRGPVRSVCLFLAGPLERIRRVALDTSSRTSAGLVRVLLSERLGREPEYVPMPPSVEGMLREADAALVIGDPALDYDGPAERLDLGAEWTRLTGLPFVWAFWAGRVGALQAAGLERLQRALREGLADLAGVVAAYNPTGDARRAAFYEAYLRESIVYALGDHELRGLVEFYRRASALGLIARVPELRFHGAR
jgi:chorismate dehydratase